MKKEKIAIVGLSAALAITLAAYFTLAQKNAEPDVVSTSTPQLTQEAIVTETPALTETPQATTTPTKEKSKKVTQSKKYTVAEVKALAAKEMKDGPNHDGFDVVSFKGYPIAIFHPTDVSADTFLRYNGKEFVSLSGIVLKRYKKDTGISSSKAEIYTTAINSQKIYFRVIARKIGTSSCISYYYTLNDNGEFLYKYSKKYNGGVKINDKTTTEKKNAIIGELQSTLEYYESNNKLGEFDDGSISFWTEGLF